MGILFGSPNISILLHRVKGTSKGIVTVLTLKARAKEPEHDSAQRR